MELPKTAEKVDHESLGRHAILGEQKCLPKAWKGSFPSRKSWVPMSRHNVETLVFSYRDAYFKKRNQDNFNKHGGEILL